MNFDGHTDADLSRAVLAAVRVLALGAAPEHHAVLRQIVRLGREELRRRTQTPDKINLVNGGEVSEQGK